MAHQFGLRPIDDADEAFDMRAPKCRYGGAGARQGNQEWQKPRVVEVAFVAIRMRWVDALDLKVAVPIRRRGDRAGVSAHANQCNVILTKVLPAELTDVKLPSARAHLGVPGVSDVRIVRPDDRLGRVAPRV